VGVHGPDVARHVLAQRARLGRHLDVVHARLERPVEESVELLWAGRRAAGESDMDGRGLR
jgi:hypothetical protein